MLSIAVSRAILIISLKDCSRSLAVEMETSALYMLAARYNVQALGVFTVSNHLFTGEETTAKEREQSFNDMIKIALETAIDNKEI